jgi:hypothetical protein
MALKIRSGNQWVDVSASGSGAGTVVITPTSITSTSTNSTSGTSHTHELQSGAVTASKLNGGQTGAPPVYGIRAWANINGTLPNGSKIRASGNIQSAISLEAGRFDFTFTTPMPDANYAVVASLGTPIATEADNTFVTRLLQDSLTTSGFSVRCSQRGDNSDARYDPPLLSVMVVG